MLEYPILVILIVFAATTIFYVMLYWRISSGCSKPHVPRREDIDEGGEVAKLKSALPGDYARLERMLEELKEIRRRAELLLDEDRGSEGEGSSDKRSPEGD